MCLGASIHKLISVKLKIKLLTRKRTFCYTTKTNIEQYNKCCDREEYASVDITERRWLVEIFMERMRKVTLEQESRTGGILRICFIKFSRLSHVTGIRYRFFCEGSVLAECKEVFL